MEARNPVERYDPFTALRGDHGAGKSMPIGPHSGTHQPMSGPISNRSRPQYDAARPALSRPDFNPLLRLVAKADLLGLWMVF